MAHSINSGDTKMNFSNFCQRAFLLVHSVNKCITFCISSLHRLQTDLLDKPNFQRHFLTPSIVLKNFIWNHINTFSCKSIKANTEGGF